VKLSPDSPLFGCFAKIDRSLKNLETLNQAGERFSEDHLKGGVVLLGEANPQRTKYLISVEVGVRFPFPEWGVIVGDVVHCLRSALDQLVYSLSDDPDDRSGFPTATTEKEWKTRAPRLIWGVPENFVAVIDEAQPYKRGNAADTHPLFILNKLSNLDKHRAIPVVALVPSRTDLRVTETEGIASHGSIRLRTGKALENGAVVADCKIVPDDSGLEPKMDMKGSLGCDIAFGGEPIPSAIHGKPVLLTFAQFLGPEVSRIVNTCLTLDT
jgi:hypothetical protein